MIKSKEDYLAYVEADKLARGVKKPSLKKKLKKLVLPDHIYEFQLLLRKVEYLGNIKKGPFEKLSYLYYKIKFRRLSIKLGFSIPPNVFGPGLYIAHYGTIVVNSNARVGANCRIHVCTNIGASGGSKKAPQLGDNVYIAPGVKIFGDISIANNIAIGANSVVNKSFKEEHVAIAGVPAKVIGKVNMKALIPHI